jgi:hypothetical protein
MYHRFEICDILAYAMIAQTRESLAKLVTQFQKINQAALNESQTRLSFIDEFWNALGWNIKDPTQVQVETHLRNVGKPDYRFWDTHNKTAFFVEAKKPAEDLRNPKHIYQAKLYGWNGSVELVILTDFEEFRPFRSVGKPKLTDKDKGLIKAFDLTYDQYPDDAERLLATFGREAVLGGSIPKLVKATKAELKDTVDKDFLATLSAWREQLAHHIASRNKFANEFDLGEAVQRILDRLVFLRILQDRSIETERYLEQFVERGAEHIYPRFVQVCQRLQPK